MTTPKKTQKLKNKFFPQTLREPRALLGIAVLATVPLFVFGVPSVTSTSYKAQVEEEQEGVIETAVSPTNGGPTVSHVPLPHPLEAIYMTACVAGTPTFRAELVSLIEETEINAVVIDIKDFSGTISFPTDNPMLLGAWQNANCGARDMKEFIASLHEKGIFVIGRITVFQDPYYTGVRPDLAVKRASDGGVWQDYKKLSFIDVGAHEYWDYIVELSKESYNLGFDELNYDYVRFPSDGNMKDIAFTHTSGTKVEQLERFFAYLSEKVGVPSLYGSVAHVGHGRDQAVPYTSVDLFGMTTTNTDDLNIGQQLERALPHFDFVAPMVYPSHYPKGFNGWSNPNNHPYELVHFVMSAGVRRTVADRSVVPTLGSKPILQTVEVLDEVTGATTTTQIATGLYTKESYDKDKLRTWIQDFDYGGNYDVAEVKAQIQASRDAGVDSFMIWAPSNRYTRGALLSP